MSQQRKILLKALVNLLIHPLNLTRFFKAFQAYGFNKNTFKHELYLLAHTSVKTNASAYTKINVGKSSILLISHELSNTGAPKALYLLAEVLQKANYDLVLVAPSDGPMRKSFEALNIPMIIDETLLLQGQAQHFIEFAAKFKLVFVNTIVCAPVIKALEGKVTTFWWLHEGKTIHEFIEHTRLFVYKNTLQKAKNLYIVSEYAKTYLDHYNQNAKVIELGIPDQAISIPRPNFNNKNKLIFSMIGAITHKKGFDILINTIKALPPSYQDRAQFKLIGKINDADFFKEINKTIVQLPCIQYLGPLEPSEVLKVLAQTDALLCISRDDSFPLVTIEAWMCGVPCILSTSVGTSKYVAPGKNGFIIDNNQPEQLKELLCKIIDHSEDLAELSKQSRALYIEKFSINKFSDNWLKEINQHFLG